MSVIIKNILAEYVQGLFNIIGKKYDKVILYGSYANGNENLDGEISDLDIMILIDCEDCEVKEIQKKVLDYSYEYDLKYNILLSPIVESTQNFDKKVKYMEFYKKVQKEGVLIDA